MPNCMRRRWRSCAGSDARRPGLEDEQEIMAKRKSGALLTQIRLARDGMVSLRRQLEDQLREAILGGLLTGGTRLPSSRALAEELEVSRPTVVQALDGLVAEGLLESRHGRSEEHTSELQSREKLVCR